MAALISQKYEVLGLLGRGGMGAVYKVRHTTLETVLALKVLPSDFMNNPDLITRFHREARVMARFNHPHIVRVLDIDRDENLNFYYFTMEYIHGKTLKDYLQEKGAIPLPRVIELSHQVAGALAYIHSHTPPVIHRDIKPANIMIAEPSGQAVLMDFGIAKQFGESELTGSRVMLGTLKYCPPEQMRHESLDGRTDIYALGMVMYEMYTGRQFFAGIDEQAVIEAVLNGPGENIPRFNSSTPPQFAQLVTKAIAKDYSRRYSRVEELLRDLEECQGIATSSAPLKEEDETVTIILPPRSKGQLSEEERIEGINLANQPETPPTAAVLHQAEQAQQAATAARTEAEQFKAQEQARTLYNRGVNLLLQADEHLSQKTYPQAESLYQEARSFFNDARASASQKARRDEAEAIRTRASAAREAAEKEHSTISLAFQQGQTHEQEAHAAMEQSDFTEARDLYLTAYEQYELARQQTRTEQQRQQALTTQRQGKKAQQQAEEAGAPLSAPAWYRVAVDAQVRGDAWMEAGAYDEATVEYAHAQESYEQAAREALQAGEKLTSQEQRQQAAPNARQEMEEARARAAQARAPERLTEVWTQAPHLAEQGQVKEEGGDNAQASSLDEQAAQRSLHSRHEAALQAARERVGIVRAHMLEVKNQINPTASQAAEAQRHEMQADQAWQAQQYGLAWEEYAQAAYLYKIEWREREQKQRQGTSVPTQSAGPRDMVATVNTEATATQPDIAHDTEETTRQFAERHQRRRALPYSFSWILLLVSVAFLILIGIVYALRSFSPSRPRVLSPSEKPATRLPSIPSPPVPTPPKRKPTAGQDAALPQPVIRTSAATISSAKS